MGSKAPNPNSETHSADPKIYEHYGKVVDGVTRDKVSENTTLDALYNFKDSSVDNKLLENLTGIAEPAVRCGLKLDGQGPYPPDRTHFYGYDLYITYNKLVSLLNGAWDVMNIV